MARTTRELTDAQWAKLAPLLPPQRPRMGRPPKDHRLIVEAIVWLDRTGAPWRDLPSQFGPWETVASRFYRWRRQGIWDRVLAALQADTDARGELDWLLHFVDGSVVRAHQHAAGARRRPATADLDTGGLWSILTSRAIGIGRRWAAAAAATPPSCTLGSKVGAGRW
jgi:transposase